ELEPAGARHQCSPLRGPLGPRLAPSSRISELLRRDQRVDQVGGDEHGEDQAQDVVVALHAAASRGSSSCGTSTTATSGPMIRPHRCTSPTLSAKNATMMATNTTSAMSPPRGDETVAATVGSGDRAPQGACALLVVGGPSPNGPLAASGPHEGSAQDRRQGRR